MQKLVCSPNSQSFINCKPVPNYRKQWVNTSLRVAFCIFQVKYSKLTRFKLLKWKEQIPYILHSLFLLTTPPQRNLLLPQNTRYWKAPNYKKIKRESFIRHATCHHSIVSPEENNLKLFGNRTPKTANNKCTFEIRQAESLLKRLPNSIEGNFYGLGPNPQNNNTNSYI